MIKYESSLEYKFPNLAKEWDYERNQPLRPSEIAYGSHKEVWWICPKCNHSYPKKICNRTAPSKQATESENCPICLGRYIIPGYNSLKARFPKLVEEEWDYEKNEVNPDEIAPHTNKDYWWICSICHKSYKSKPNNKVIGNGGNCPYCSHQKLTPENSLALVNPKLAKEWHPTKNGNLNPSEVFANHNGKVWWLCPTCGCEWSAKVSNRNINKRGCPYCARCQQSSIPEQLIYRTVKAFYNDAKSRYKLGKDEIDIYIPSLHIGIEYDGGQYHNKRVLERDIKKSRRISNHGVKLYRFRELECPDMENSFCEVIKIEYSSEHSDLQEKLQGLLTNIKGENVYFDFKTILNEVIEDLKTVPFEDSFEGLMQRKEKEEGYRRIALWDYTLNAPLSPANVRPYSDKVVSWICPINHTHKWEKAIKIVSNGQGCPKCSSRKRYTTDEWIEEAKRVHGDKYDYSKVNYIDSKQEVVIICPKHGEFNQKPSEHLSGKGCKFCAHQAFHPEESLMALYPKIASEWDYERNKVFGYTPENIGINNTIEFYWHCDKGKNHSYQSTIAYRVRRNSGCSICHGKQVISETSFGSQYPDLAKEWCAENDKTPYEVTPGSEYNALWKCPNPNHEPYRCMVGNRTRKNTGCPYCTPHGKKHPKDFRDDVKNKYPDILLIKEFTKTSVRVDCKCTKCGYQWSPFPHNLINGGCPNCRKENKKKNK